MKVPKELLDQVRDYARAHDLPVPREEIDSGLEGVVYTTMDQDVAVKITDSMGGYDLLGMQGPGVIEITHLAEIPVIGRYGAEVPILAIWMERLQATGSDIFELLGIPTSIGDQIDSALESVNLVPQKELKRRGGIPLLREYAAFDELNSLLMQHGWRDMGLRNIGLNSRGKVVVFDI